MVAWCPGNGRAAVGAGGCWAVIIIGILTLNNGFVWMQGWWTWAILVTGEYFIYRSGLLRECAAGADWVAQGRRWFTS